MALRPQVKLIAGRWFTPGQREVVVSQKLARRFASFHAGDTFRREARAEPQWLPHTDYWCRRVLSCERCVASDGRWTQKPTIQKYQTLGGLRVTDRN